MVPICNLMAVPLCVCYSLNTLAGKNCQEHCPGHTNCPKHCLGHTHSQELYKFINIQIVRNIVNCDSMIFYLNHPFSEMLTQSLSLIHTGYLVGSLTLMLVETFDCDDDELVTDEAWITVE